MEIFIWIVCILVGLFLVGWLGLHIKPNSFPLFQHRTPTMQTVPLPAGLPAPVERFYRQIYGDMLPLITSAVITGRATMRPVLKVLPFKVVSALPMWQVWTTVIISRCASLVCH